MTKTNHDKIIGVYTGDDTLICLGCSVDEIARAPLGTTPANFVTPAVSGALPDGFTCDDCFMVFDTYGHSPATMKGN